MPEISTPANYRLPAIRYEAPRTPTFEPTQIVPDLRGAAALKGSAASMGLVADTIAKLPDIITKGLQGGRQEAQQSAVHKIKMSALSGGQSPSQIKALQGFSFGDDDSLSYRPQDPALAALQYQNAAADLAYREAMTEKAKRTKGSLYETLLDADTDGLPAPDGAGVTGEILPPLPPNAAAPRAPQSSGGIGNGTVMDSQGNARPVWNDVALPGAPELGAVPDGGQGRAALADLPAPEALPNEPAAKPAPVAAEPPKEGIVRAVKPGEAHKFYRGGKLAAELLPGANTWVKVEEKPDGATFPTKEAAEAAGWDTAGAAVNADGSITVKKIPFAKDQQVPAGLAKEARDLGLNAYGKDPKAVTEEIINFRRAEKILTPEQAKNVNAIQTKLSSDVAYKDIQNVKQAYTAMQGSQKEDSAIGDVALINSFQRIIDPGVSVREGDVALIQKSAGVFEQLKNLPDVWAGNARIPDKMRTQMIALAKEVYATKVKNFYESKGKAVIEQAKAYNITPEHYDVLGLDFGIPLEGVDVPGVKKAAPAAPAAPNGKPAAGEFMIGKRYRGEDGSIRVYLGGPIEDEANWGS